MIDVPKADGTVTLSNEVRGLILRALTEEARYPTILASQLLGRFIVSMEECDAVVARVLAALTPVTTYKIVRHVTYEGTLDQLNAIVEDIYADGGEGQTFNGAKRTLQVIEDTRPMNCGPVDRVPEGGEDLRRPYGEAQTKVIQDLSRAGILQTPLTYPVPPALDDQVAAHVADLDTREATPATEAEADESLGEA